MDMEIREDVQLWVQFCYVSFSLLLFVGDVESDMGRPDYQNPLLGHLIIVQKYLGFI